MLKKYRLGFDFWGVLLFFLIMIPNLIWFAIPAPNDVLRVDSVTTVVDIIASICQVLMIIALCVVINKEKVSLILSPLIIIAVACCLLYFTSWFFYYTGITNAAIILGLSLFPCLTFLLYAVDRKNMIAIILISIFTVCHMIYGIVNFVVY
ncbi:hypothetical protein [Anaerotignum sp.]|uniref:hypothetical protein n=1 Tax=Anaerotignum sp. TaxID=2039241 RepID=UPI00289F61DB|nr:hypothetical protein [Anaerotignum sp.]